MAGADGGWGPAGKGLYHCSRGRETTWGPARGLSILQAGASPPSRAGYHPTVIPAPESRGSGGAHGCHPPGPGPSPSKGKGLLHPTWSNKLTTPLSWSAGYERGDVAYHHQEQPLCYPEPPPRPATSGGMWRTQRGQPPPAHPELVEGCPAWGVAVNREGQVYVTDWRNGPGTEDQPPRGVPAEVGRAGQRSGPVQPSGWHRRGRRRRCVRGRLAQPPGAGVQPAWGVPGRVGGDATMSTWGEQLLAANSIMQEQRRVAKDLGQERRLLLPRGVQRTIRTGCSSWTRGRAGCRFTGRHDDSLTR